MSEQKSSGENSSEDNLPGENSLHSVKHSSYSRDLWFVVTSVQANITKGLFWVERFSILHNLLYTFPV